MAAFPSWKCDEFGIEKLFFIIRFRIGWCLGNYFRNEMFHFSTDSRFGRVHCQLLCAVYRWRVSLNQPNQTNSEPETNV